MQGTYTATPSDIVRAWYIVDAANKPVGRLASDIARVLRGKHKPTFTPHIDTGDFVVVVNAEKVAFTGRKLEGKLYRRHSGYMGGLSETPAKDLIAKRPIKAVEEAIKGMLPKTKLGNAMYTKLKVYAGSAHRHAAQRPQTINLKSK